MNNHLKKLRLGLALFALPFVASASAQEWVAPAVPTATAAQTDNYLEGSRSHSVTLNRVGQLEGRITSGNQTGELNVYFVREGKIVTRTTTQDGGYFIADGVTEGDYSFIATGQGGFVAYGVQVKPYDQVTGVNAIEAATVSAGYDGIQRILKNSVPSQIAAEISGVERREVSAPAFAGSNVVKLVNGQLSGKVATFDQNRQPVYGTEVFVIQNDRQIARTTADANGSFTVASLDAGTYDFIAAGSNGIAAVRFQAVNDDSVLNSTSDPFQPVSFRKTVAATASAALQVCLTCEADSGFVEEQIDYCANDAVIVDSVPSEPTAPIEYASESLGCGCAAGGSCGSCGSFSGAGAGLVGRGGLLGGGGGFGGGGALIGGGGSFSRLIGLGGLAGGIIALSTDSDGSPVQASPSTTN